MGLDQIDQQPNQKIKQGTVLIGTASLEDPIDGQGSTLMGIITPSALTSSSMTLRVSSDGLSFFDYFTSSGTQVSIQIGTDRYIAFVASDFFPIRFIQIVLDQNEAAERLFKFIYRAP